MLLVALLGCLVVADAQFIAGNRPACKDVLDGVTFMAHEKYAQLYYHCNREKQFTRFCQVGDIWNSAINNCLPPERELFLNGKRSANNWECVNGRNYPDLCCSHYWTCDLVARPTNGLWTRKTCDFNQQFDAALGQCRQGVGCSNETKCQYNVPPNQNLACPFSANVNDQCKFMQGDVVQSCGAGTIWSQDKCTCDMDVLDQCVNQATTFIGNKNLDPSCRASYRVMFNGPVLEAFSDKLQTGLGRGFLSNVRMGSNEAIFSGGNSFLYSYFLAGNEYTVPVAFSVNFKPDDVGLNQQQSFTLLTNQFDAARGALDDTCAPTMVVNAVSTPRQSTLLPRTWRFDIEVRSPAGVQETFSVSANANANSWLRFTMTYSKGQESDFRVTVSELNGVNAQDIGSGQSSNRLEAFPFNKCGLTVGRNLVGRVSEINVYEGCGNSFINI